MAETFDGGCACGEVRYRLTDRPLFTHCCHCTWCQRETGSAFVLNGIIETSCVDVVSGAPEEIMTPSESGQGQIIARCPTCHVALWSTYSSAGPKFRFVRIGTLDETERVPPDIHIFTSTKLPWITLDDGKPVMTEYYRRSTHWPEWALERRKRALEA